MNEFETWVKREHPSGQIDWQKEFDRLLAVAEQSLNGGNAAHYTLEIAVEMGKKLQQYADNLNH